MKRLAILLLALSLISIATAVPNNLTVGLRAYYDLNNDTGNFGEDVHTGTYNLTRYGNARNSSFYFLGKGSLGSIQNDFLELDTDFGIGDSNSYSTSAWVYHTQDPGSGKGLLVFTNNAGQTAGQIQFQTDQIRVIMNDQESNRYLDSNTNISINLSQWYHVVATLDAVAGEARLYLNGVEIAFTNESTSQDRDFERFWINGKSSLESIDGYVDEVGIWNRSLTSDEVLLLNNNSNGFDYESMSFEVPSSPPAVNNPPVLQSKNPTGNTFTKGVQDSQTFTATFTDADNDTILYQWYLDDISQGGETTNSYTSNAGSLSEGSYNLSISATDGENVTTTYWMVTVTSGYVPDYEDEDLAPVAVDVIGNILAAFVALAGLIAIILVYLYVFERRK